MANAKRLVVARVRIHKGIQIETPETVRADVAPGQPLQLQVQYDIAEAADGKESYRLYMESRLGDERSPPAERVHKDVPMKTDSWIGVIDQEYTFNQPGINEGTLRLEVEYRMGDWLPGGSKGLERESVTVPIRIDVG